MRISAGRGLLVSPVLAPCVHCGRDTPLAYRSAPGPLMTLIALGGMASTGGVGLAVNGLPAIGWPVLVLGLLHYVAAWWTSSPPRAADLPGRPGDSIRS